MCVGFPGKVVDVECSGSGFATVDVRGARHRVNLALLEDTPGVGDWVICQLGFAMEHLTEAEATETIHLLEVLEASVADELVGV